MGREIDREIERERGGRREREGRKEGEGGRYREGQEDRWQRKRQREEVKAAAHRAGER